MTDHLQKYARRLPNEWSSLKDDSGLSLIEVIVVLAILSAIYAVAAFSLSRPPREPSLRLTVAQLASQLRGARTRAIARNENIAFVFDAAQRSFRLQGSSHRTKLPKGVNLQLTTARPFARRIDDAKLVFFPDGSSSGGKLVFSSRREKLVVSVAWLTGAVIVKGDSP